MLKKRISIYYDCLWDSNQGIEDGKIISDLPDSLRAKV
jgi:uncharacterized protein VirK/YbjX